MRCVSLVPFSDLEECGDGYRISRRSGEEALRQLLVLVRWCDGDRRHDQRAFGILKAH